MDPPSSFWGSSGEGRSRPRCGRWESQTIRLGEGSQPVFRWGRGKENDQTRAKSGLQRARQAGFWTSPFPSGRLERLLPTSNQTHLLLQKLWELTQNHRREEKQQFPPGFPLGAHYNYNADAKSAATLLGMASRSTALGLESARQVEPGPPSSPRPVGGARPPRDPIGEKRGSSYE